MSLKKTANSGILKKTFRKQFLTEKSLNEALKTTTNDNQNSAEDRRKHHYKPLHFSKRGSSKMARLYTTNRQKSKEKNEVTIISETDTEGELEDKKQRKEMTMAERFKPKVILKEVLLQRLLVVGLLQRVKLNQ